MGWLAQRRDTWEVLPAGRRALDEASAGIKSASEPEETDLSSARTLGITPLERCLERAQGVVRHLRELGWWPSGLPIALKTTLSHIESLISHACAKALNPGAYVYVALVKGCSLTDRLHGLCKTTLRDLPHAVQKAFVGSSEDWRFTINEARYLASSLAKVFRSGRAVTVGDVRGIAAYVARPNRI